MSVRTDSAPASLTTAASIVAGASNKTDGTGAAYVFAADATPTPTPTPTPNASPSPSSVVQFSATTFAAAEGPPGSVTSGLNSGEVNSWDAAGLTAQASAVINVTRTGDVSGSATVDYATVDGSASARSDYSAAHGTCVSARGKRQSRLWYSSPTIVSRKASKLFRRPFKSNWRDDRLSGKRYYQRNQRRRS